MTSKCLFWKSAFPQRSCKTLQPHLQGSSKVCRHWRPTLLSIKSSTLARHHCPEGAWTQTTLTSFSVSRVKGSNGMLEWMTQTFLHFYPVNRAILSRSEQTVNRVWKIGVLVKDEHSDWKLLAHLCSIPCPVNHDHYVPLNPVHIFGIISVIASIRMKR